MDPASCKKLIVLLESSSSSDSEDDTIIATIQEHRRERPKVDNFVADVVASFDDEEFRRHFRLSRSTCRLSLNHSHGETPQKSAEEHILAFLWYAGKKATFRSVAQLFGMSESTLHEVVDRVADFLEAVAPKFLKMPLTEEEKQQTSVCFEAAGRFHIIADAAYPLREYIMTPFRDHGHMTVEEKRFNYRLSRTRVRIENAFGVLKSRFRQLLYLEFHTPERSTKFMLACCVLHNICIMNGERDMDDESGTDDSSDEENTQDSTATTRLLRRLGEANRRALARSFN
ncbi:hypothetical protein HPB52_003484 [Rhipicephalus sanguineus]|uniref:DDE Tnp4 domain-containing protein n=1 Tax=Rhipicephalus sanguineus TaxID=34632 RepID=A0A9D4Q9G2_RHISA|nr:hypothetical protein HPB52_003484 [Rhipicephalus sanguineus]